MTRIVVVGDMPESGMALGCDVSQFQRPTLIDWKKAAESIGFAMARVSCGMQVDPAGLAHLRGIVAASITPWAYHFVNERPVASQWDAFRSQLDAAGVGSGWVAPCLDLEWIPGTSGSPVLPVDKPGYRRIVSTLLDRCRERFGGVSVYSSIGFWQGVGCPSDWIEDGVEWMVPWYPKRPKGRLTEAEARTYRWPQRPGIPTPAVWQFDALEVPWAKCGEIDHNLARRLPMISEV